MELAPRNRSHATQACKNCRAKKAKCAGGPPTCARCGDKGLQCTWKELDLRTARGREIHYRVELERLNGENALLRAENARLGTENAQLRVANGANPQAEGLAQEGVALQLFSQDETQTRSPLPSELPVNGALGLQAEYAPFTQPPYADLPASYLVQLTAGYASWETNFAGNTTPVPTLEYMAEDMASTAAPLAPAAQLHFTGDVYGGQPTSGWTP